jgi:hypothetical protein
MKNPAKTTAFYLSLITGLLLVFIGCRFLISPAVSETDFGIHVTTGDYSFHYIKGIRDLFAGAIICVLLFAKEYRALGFVLLFGGMIPVVDFMVVYTHPDHETARLYPHLIAIILSIVLGSYYLYSTRKK